MVFPETEMESKLDCDLSLKAIGRGAEGEKFRCIYIYIYIYFIYRVDCMSIKLYVLNIFLKKKKKKKRRSYVLYKLGYSKIYFW